MQTGALLAYFGKRAVRVQNHMVLEIWWTALDLANVWIREHVWAVGQLPGARLNKPPGDQTNYCSYHLVTSWQPGNKTLGKLYIHGFNHIVIGNLLQGNTSAYIWFIPA